MGIELEIWLEELMYTEASDMTPEERLRHPCVNVCNGWVRNDGVCTGCFRDLKQIANWASYSDEELREQVQLVNKRRGTDETI